MGEELSGASSEAMEKIKKRQAQYTHFAAEAAEKGTRVGGRLELYAEDVGFLLEAIKELEEENESLKLLIERALLFAYTVRPDTTDEEEGLIEELQAAIDLSL